MNFLELRWAAASILKLNFFFSIIMIPSFGMFTVKEGNSLNGQNPYGLFIVTEYLWEVIKQSRRRALALVLLGV